MVIIDPLFILIQLYALWLESKETISEFYQLKLLTCGISLQFNFDEPPPEQQVKFNRKVIA